MLDIIKTRRSVRKFKPDPVSGQDIQDIRAPRHDAGLGLFATPKGSAALGWADCLGP